MFVRLVDHSNHLLGNLQALQHFATLRHLGHQKYLKVLSHDRFLKRVTVVAVKSQLHCFKAVRAIKCMTGLATHTLSLFSTQREGI